MSAPLTSEQVNYLVWRYLQESGFEKSTFSFQDDCRAQHLEGKFKNWVKPGALINIIQKGLQYLALEASIYENGTVGTTKVFSYFGPPNGQEEPTAAPPSADVPMEDAANDIEMTNSLPIPAQLHEESNGVSIEVEAQKAELLREPPQTNGTVTPIKRSHDLATTTAPEVNGIHSQRTKRAKTAAAVGEDAMIIDGISLPDTTSEEVRATIGSSIGVQADEYIQLDRESIGVYHLSPLDTSLDSAARNCKFSPSNKNSLAVSLDTCHLFNLGDELFTPSQNVQDLVLFQQFGEEMSTIAWSDNGEHLATASWDGLIKIWDDKGRLRQSLKMHRAPILSLKFHPAKYNLLLSVDGHSKVNVWDVATGKLKKQCELSVENSVNEKTTPYDADWVNDNTIVAVGGNGAVEKFDLSMPLENGPHLDSIVRYEGHDAHKNVSSVIWSSGHDMFATGGEDGKIMLWKPSQFKPVGILEGHQDEISFLQLSHGSDSSESLLASSSADGSVRIWDIENRICLHVLYMQSPVDVLSFTADGKYLAAGAQNLIVMVWLTETGRLVGMYDAKPGEDVLSVQSTMEDLSWDKEGSRLAVAVRDQKCAIIDWKTLLNDAATKRLR
ncbi:hypothetical protein TWF106_007897 [Orbilia oligospora]|uniref:WD40 repeat-like protein n=4 Tax=Orbilia oligospora TaxID=2813651 RepID=A0A6G1M7G6_ORBOL|nr:hypothetical protein TWF788_001802 [Orbilia oligospora]KAF3204653.1 hypothetical protein TWF191_002216 [Orbilia oligospora]KAF3217589.1 hypothetical protein TWF106_007897 [Orbilia oligospora]KAF3245828.1 hypothetical protein TWF192_007303 [Orbilia oligospora]